MNRIINTKRGAHRLPKTCIENFITIPKHIFLSQVIYSENVTYSFLEGQNSTKIKLLIDLLNKLLLSMCLLIF